MSGGSSFAAHCFGLEESRGSAGSVTPRGYSGDRSALAAQQGWPTLGVPGSHRRRSPAPPPPPGPPSGTAGSSARRRGRSVEGASRQSRSSEPRLSERSAVPPPPPAPPPPRRQVERRGLSPAPAPAMGFPDERDWSNWDLQDEGKPRAPPLSKVEGAMLPWRAPAVASMPQGWFGFGAQEEPRCCRCNQVSNSYFDHSCPGCRAIMCMECLDDFRLILRSYRCPKCGDEEANQASLEHHVLVINAYRNTRRAVGAISESIVNLFNFGTVRCGEPEREESEAADAPVPPQLNSTAVPGAAPGVSQVRRRSKERDSAQRRDDALRRIRVELDRSAAAEDAPPPPPAPPARLQRPDASAAAARHQATASAVPGRSGAPASQRRS
eukprot:TRINITY_DN25352_c0_g1_i1.p1 TRINITY_DN25352_c0_g1~~TRINITY_DN25352_c0_g1_i1.p1  ORF type:complete len:382 (-),score=66.34 TRINITY_DN25352_c0_g1_i1:137-1282(-)